MATGFIILKIHSMHMNHKSVDSTSYWNAFNKFDSHTTVKTIISNV